MYQSLNMAAVLEQMQWWSHSLICLGIHGQLVSVRPVLFSFYNLCHKVASHVMNQQIVLNKSDTMLGYGKLIKQGTATLHRDNRARNYCHTRTTLTLLGMTSKKTNGLFNDIDQKGGWVSCRNH